MNELRIIETVSVNIRLGKINAVTKITINNRKYLTISKKKYNNRITIIFILSLISPKS